MMTDKGISDTSVPLTPIPHDPAAQVYWLEAVMNRVVQKTVDVRSAEIEELRKNNKEHNERLTHLENSTAAQTEAITKLAEKHDKVIEMLEPVVTTGKFIRMIERGLKWIANSWIVRLFVVTGVIIFGWVHVGWKAVLSALSMFFK